VNPVSGLSRRKQWIVTTRMSARSRPGLALATLCLASFMASLDLFVVNVALRDIGVRFGGDALANASWVLNAYSIFFGAVLIPAGRLADHFGRRQVFVIGLVIFTVSSLACALSPSFWVLVGLRCAQAVGAAVLVPASLGLVLTTLPEERVRHGVRVWSITGAVAGATGPVVGGLLTQVDWRLVFLLNIPVGVTAIALTLLLIPATARRQGTTIPAPAEVVTIIVGLGALSLGVVKGPDWGWTSGRITAIWAVTIVAIGVFVLANRRAADPVIDLKLFRSRVFSSANAGMVLFSLSIVMTILGMSLYLQQSWRWSAIATGAAIAPGPAFLFLTSQVVTRFGRRLPAGWATAAGFLVVGIGQVLLIISITGHPGAHDYWTIIFPGWVLTGIGSGLSLPTLTSSATADLPERASAAGSAVIQVSRQFGTVLGTAALIAVIGKAISTGETAPFLVAWWVAAGVCLVGALVALGINQRHRSTAR
jgi:EmrB/QacA subfamily drug resistance transporter